MAESWIVRTQETLGTLIAKPTMSVKFLSKPPFRFLFDAYAATAAQTGFGRGLWPSCPSEREDKLEFMTRLIALIGLALGEALAVNPIKVVCGLEPEQTNFMLQQLHAAATTQAHRSDEILARVQAGERPQEDVPEVVEPPSPPPPVEEPAAEAPAVEEEVGEELAVEKPITYDAEQQAVRDILDAVDVDQFEIAAPAGEVQSMEYRDAAEIQAEYAELEERARRIAEMKREKQQQMQQTAPATALPELDLDMSSSDDESSEEGDDGGQRKAEKDVHRLLDDIDAELEDPPSPAKPPADAEVPPPPEEPAPLDVENADNLDPADPADAQTAGQKPKKKKKRTKEEREAKRERRRLRAEAAERAKFPESKHSAVQRAILLDEDREEEAAADADEGLQAPLDLGEKAASDHGDSQRLMVELMASLGPTWMTFVLASPAPALVAQHGSTTVFSLLREMLHALKAGVDADFFESERFKEELPYLGEELATSFPTDWLEFVCRTPKEFMEERYGLDEVLELFQGICQSIHDHLEETGVPLPEALAYVPPPLVGGEEAEHAQAPQQAPASAAVDERERQRLRSLGNAIVGGR